MEVVSARAVVMDERMQELLLRAEEIEKSGDMVSAYLISKRIEVALVYKNADEKLQRENKDERFFFVECILETKRKTKTFQHYCCADSKENAIAEFCQGYKLKPRLFEQSKA